MTKFDHEKQNRLDRAKKEQPNHGICSAPEMRTFRGVLKSALKKETAPRSKPDLRESCDKCGQKVLPKNMGRHHFICHNLMACPICNESHTGRKKLGRHIKKQHGHRAYSKYKKVKFNKALHRTGW